MKILFVTHGFPPDQMAGAEIYAWRIGRALLARGCEVSVLTASNRVDRDEGTIEREELDGLEVFRFQNAWTDLDRLAATYRSDAAERAFDALLRELRPDVVHVHHVIGTSAGIIALAKSRGIRCVVTLHDFWFQCARGQRMTPRGHLCTTIQPWRCAICIGKKRVKYALQFTREAATGSSAIGEAERLAESAVGRLLRLPARLLGYGLAEGATKTLRERRRFMREALLDADLLISPSAFLRDEFLRDGIPADRIVVSENGLDATPFATVAPVASPGDGNPVRFGFVGTLIPTKGIEILIDAFQALPPERARLDIHGAGGGPNAARYVEELKARNRHPSVTFHGRYHHDDVARIFAGFHVLVVPSLWYENAPLTLNEAAMAGRAVITADHGGMREFAENFGAVMFRAGDAEDLRRGLERFVAEPNRVVEGADYPRRVRSVEDDADGTLEIYRRLTERRVSG